MSNTELQRALKQLQNKQERVLSFISVYVIPLCRPRTLRGTILSPQGEPMKGVKLTLNGWRKTYTNAKGKFSFPFIWTSHYQISLQWETAELSNWIQVNAQDQKITELKLRWPRLVRGQLFDLNGYPLRQIMVTLNEHYQTSTDIHGAFFFPRNLGEEVRFERFMFEINRERFIHHFNLDLDIDCLYRFLFDGESLYHVDEVPKALPNSAYVAQIVDRFKWMIISISLILSLIIGSIIFKSTPQPLIASLNQTQTLGLTSIKPVSIKPINYEHSINNKKERMLKDPIFNSSSATTISPADLSDSPKYINHQNNDEEVVSNAYANTCNDIEFKYLNYYVPRGSERADFREDVMVSIHSLFILIRAIDVSHIYHI